MAILKLWWSGQPVDVPDRTLRRWRRTYQEEALRSGRGFAALIPGKVGRPPGPGLGPEMEAVIEQCITDAFEVHDPPTSGVFYEMVKAAVASAGLGSPPSRTTVNERVRMRDKGRAVLATAGRKMAN